MESWRRVWREGFAPQFSEAHLKSLAAALETDDPTLLQGTTTTPPPLQCVQDCPVEGACAVGYCGWKGDELNTVAEVEEFFDRACFECDQLMGEPAACRWLLNWFDDTPREEMLPEFAAEVRRSLRVRRMGEELCVPD